MKIMESSGGFRKGKNVISQNRGQKLNFGKMESCDGGPAGLPAIDQRFRPRGS